MTALHWLLSLLGIAEPLHPDPTVMMD